MINGKPASYWSGKRDAAETELAASRATFAPKAVQVDERAEHLDAIDAYQKALVSGGDAEGPLRRANDIYRSADSLGQARMVGDVLRRASALNKAQAADQVAKPVPGTTTKVSYYYR
jgi:hypothetical protein